MTTVEILKAARAKIENPENWTKGAGTRDAKGAIYPADESDEVCWCMVFAIRRTEGNKDRVWPIIAQVTGAHAETGYGISKFNDSHTHAEVLAAFDRAIELATKGASK